MPGRWDGPWPPWQRTHRHPGGPASGPPRGQNAAPCLDTTAAAAHYDTHQSVNRMSVPHLEPGALRPRRGRPPTPGLRERILRAAAVIFARRDYHEVQMD